MGSAMRSGFVNVKNTRLSYMHNHEVIINHVPGKQIRLQTPGHNLYSSNEGFQFPQSINHSCKINIMQTDMMMHRNYSLSMCSCVDVELV